MHITVTVQSEAKLSVVIPCYNAAKFIDTLFSSIDNQTVDNNLVEIIFVNDGSHDETLTKLQKFSQQSNMHIRVISQENKGVAGALNAGLRECTGEFITFVGGDDSLSPNYFSALVEAFQSSPEVNMFVTKLVRTDMRGELIPHPLDYQFNGVKKPRVVDLRYSPEMIHLHATVALRRELIEQQGFQFDENLRHGFEDAHFFARYLLKLNEPVYVQLPQAEYYYQRRDDSIIASSAKDRSKFVYLTEKAYPELLDYSDECPRWLANLILYDLYWLFAEFYRMQSSVFALPATTQFLLSERIKELILRLGLENVRSFRIVNVPLDLRAAWEGVFGANQVTQILITREFDSLKYQQKVVYYSTAPDLSKQTFAGHKNLEIVASKVREVLFFDEAWIYEHIFWLQLDESFTRNNRIFLSSKDKKTMLLQGQALAEHQVRHIVGISPLARTNTKERAKPNRAKRLISKALLKAERLGFSLAYRWSKYTGNQTKYRDAWVFIDRDFQANDNAESLYKYVRENREDINSWFVINSSSPDYKRLKADGVRVVKHGTKQHFILMKNAKALLSSMVDHYIVQPFPHKYLSKSWHFVFLQHGVTKDRIHRWLNGKTIDTLVTSTEPEYQSIVSSPGPYKFSSREVILSGMPRHDRLTNLGNASTKRPLILIMPTWRNYLLGPANGGSRDVLEGFYQSQFVSEWEKFFHSDELKRLYKQYDAEIVLLPHPGIDEHWKTLVTPPHIKRISYATDDVQQYIAKSTLAITDYSSQAFEAAYSGTPTIYFQFDRETFFSGGHIASPGYFDYERDGFGPVCTSIDELLQHVGDFVDKYPQDHEWRSRISSLYKFQDGNASKRIISHVDNVISGNNVDPERL